MAQMYYHSQEAKRRIGLAAKGRKLTEEHKKRLIEFHTGRKRSEETRKNISMALRGRRLVDHSQTICICCGGSQTSANKTKYGTSYPLWIRGLCSRCYGRYQYRRNEEKRQIVLRS